MPLIEITDLHKKYRAGDVEVHALRGLSLEVRAGEFIALMGASGSGKTTLLNILGCLDTASSGRYLLDGRVIDEPDHDRLAPTRSETLGFVFQSFNLIPVLSALENVELPMLWHPRAHSKSERRERALSLLESVGMKEHAHRRPTALSGGQQQRVAIARALANEPKLVLADEPTANLDTATADQVLDAMTSLWRREGVTFVLATHDPRILSRATRVIYVVDGGIAHGPMHDPETGTFNRPYFENRVSEEVRRAERDRDESAALLLVSFGGVPPPAAADVLRRELRGGDTLARYRQDVFAILAPRLRGDDGPLIAGRLRASLQQAAGGTDKIAAVTLPARGEPVERLLERADAALEEARATTEAAALEPA